MLPPTSQVRPARGEALARRVDCDARPMTRDPHARRSLHGLTAAFALTSALVTSACAGQPSRPAPTPITASSAAIAPTSVAPVAPKPAPQQTEVAALLENARALFRAGNKDAAFAVIAQARAGAKGDLLLGDDVALTEAALHAYAEDFDGAARIVGDRIRTPRPEDAAVFNLHDVMIFVSEARGDKTAAMLEALEMRSVAERWPAPIHPRARLGYLWQRAHTLRSFAETLSGLARETAILYAQRAREEFTALARSTLARQRRHSPPWKRPNARASITDVIRIPAPRTTACGVLRRSKAPTRQTSTYATATLKIPHNTLTVDDDNPSPGGDANGLWSGCPEIPLPR